MLSEGRCDVHGRLTDADVANYLVDTLGQLMERLVPLRREDAGQVVAMDLSIECATQRAELAEDERLALFVDHPAVKLAHVMLQLGIPAEMMASAVAGSFTSRNFLMIHRFVPLILGDS